MFKPKNGKSAREIVLELAKNFEYGSVITYKQLADACGLRLSNRTAICAAALSANKSLLKLHKRGLKSVPNVGYRIIEPREHMIVANSHQSRADRQMRRALVLYRGADLDLMTETERRLHIGQQMLAEAIMASHNRLNRHEQRIRKLEDLLNGTATVNQN